MQRSSRQAGMTLLEVVIALTIMSLVAATTAKVAMNKVREKELVQVGEKVVAVALAVERLAAGDGLTKGSSYNYSQLSSLKISSCASSGVLDPAVWSTSPLPCEFEDDFGNGFAFDSISGELSLTNELKAEIELDKPATDKENLMNKIGIVSDAIEDALRNAGYNPEQMSLVTRPQTKSEMVALVNSSGQKYKVEIKFNVGDKPLIGKGQNNLEQDASLCWQNSGTGNVCIRYGSQTLSIADESGDLAPVESAGFITDDDTDKFTVPRVTNVSWTSRYVYKPECPSGMEGQISVLPNTITGRWYSEVDFGDNNNRPVSNFEANSELHAFSVGWSSVMRNGKPAWLVSYNSKSYYGTRSNARDIHLTALTWCQ